MSVIFLPINVDFHPIFLEPLVYRPVNGTVVSGFDLFFFLAFFSWIFRYISDPKEKIKFFPHISIPFLLIWALAIIGIGQSAAPSLIKGWSLWIVFRNYLVFLYLANNCRDTKVIKTIVAMFMITLALESLFGFAQQFTGGTLGAELFGERESSFFAMYTGAGVVSRIGGTLGHPNQLAKYLELLLPLNLALLFTPVSKWWKLAIAVILLMATATMILTYSRGGWVGLSIATALCCYWCLAKLRSKLKVVSFIMIVVISATFCIAAITQLDSVRKRLFEDDYGAARSRIPMAKIAVNIIQHNPLLGVGLGNYAHEAKEASARLPMVVHNEYLLIAAELGVPASFLFLFILTVVFVLLIRISRSRDDPFLSYTAIGFFCGLLAYCIHLFIVFHYALFLNYFWFIVGLVQAMNEIQRTKMSSLD